MLSIAGRPTWACLPVTFRLNFGVSYMAGKIVPTTLMDLLERGDAAHPAIRVPDGPTVTYDSLRRQVNSLAEQLQGRGIGRGDRVAIVLPNGIEAIVCFPRRLVSRHRGALELRLQRRRVPLLPGRIPTPGP